MTISRKPLLGAFLFAASFFASSESLLDYTKRTADIYPDKLGSNGFGLEFTTRANFEPRLQFKYTKYEPADHTLMLAYDRRDGRFQGQVLDRDCKNTGAYVGENAFTAKVRVTRQTCYQIRARGPDDDLPIGMIYREAFGAKIKNASPADFRELHSFDIEFQVVTLPPTDQDFVTIHEWYKTVPTFTHPYETIMHTYVISAALSTFASFGPAPGSRLSVRTRTSTSLPNSRSAAWSSNPSGFTFFGRFDSLDFHRCEQAGTEHRGRLLIAHVRAHLC